MTAKYQLFLSLLIAFLLMPVICNSIAQHVDYLILQEKSEQEFYIDVGNDRLNQQNHAMWLLLGWGGLNILGGSALALDKRYGDFGLMSAGWGAVNAAIAVFALTGAQSYTDKTTFSEILTDEQLFNRILAINTGLNTGYIAAGLSMNYFGKTGRIKQFGTAVAVQGAFLMVFDVWLLLSSIERLKNLAIYPDMITVDSGYKEHSFFPGIVFSATF